MKPSAAAAVAAVFLIAGCSAASTSGPRHPRTPALTSEQGAAICADVAAWLPKAENARYPRFSAKLTADTARALAGRARLGLDLEGLGSDLLAENGVALSPGPPGSPQNIQLVEADCRHYGVIVPQG